MFTILAEEKDSIETLFFIKLQGDKYILQYSGQKDVIIAISIQDIVSWNSARRQICSQF